MIKLSATIVMISFAMLACSTQTPDRAGFDETAAGDSIRALLRDQEIAWNNGSIEEFMEGYWKSDSLRFIGTNVTSGWQATFERYKQGYPDRAAMGQLHFEFYRFHFISADACLVTGRYRLKRTADEPSGMFTLLFRLINNRWVIVYDHTS
jgi:hypothetical protein